MKTLTRSMITAFVLSMTLTLSELPAAPPGVYGQGMDTGSGGTPAVFLPTVIGPLGPPQFTIISPADGLKVSGTSIFAVQPIQPQTIAKVTFRAGVVTLGTDTTPADGYQLFLDVSQLPAGPLELTATATGPAGDISSKSIHVTVVPNPPASAAVGVDGNTLGTANGSTVVVPPGAVSTTTTVAVQDKTQAQVTADNGIDWDGLGVTFLGAIDVQASGPISKPLGVSSAGFGNRIQPGQAVVTYRLFPDADGDGADELVVVNGAKLAPNGTIVSPPVVPLSVDSMQTQSASTMTSAEQRGQLGGPPGTTIKIAGSGFNLTSATANVALFHSFVDYSERRVPVYVRAEQGNAVSQTIIVTVPDLPAGPAQFTLRNESTSATVGPFALTVAISPPLSRPAAEIIDQVLAANIVALHELATLATEPVFQNMAAQIPHAISKTEQLRALFQQIAATPTPTQTQGLNLIAGMFEQSTAIFHNPAEVPALVVTSDVHYVCDNLGQVGLIAGAVGALGALTAGLGTSTAAITAIGLAATAGPAVIVTGIIITGVAIVAGIGIGLGCWDKNPPVQCAPSPAGANGGPPHFMTSNVRRSLAQNSDPLQPLQTGVTMGMGGAPPPGGDGCGDIMGIEEEGLVQSAAQTGLQAGRFMVRIFPRAGTGRALTPFTGASDPGGDFFIPLIPVTEPFKAVALDNLTGATAVVTGTGPALGDSVYMFFDFSGVQGNHFAIAIGDTVTAGVPEAGAGELPPGGADLYTFSAAAGQQVFFDLFDVQVQLFTAKWKLTAPSGSVLFDQNLGCCGGVDVGVRTLPEAGLYTLRVGDNTEPITATYGFTLWNVPLPDRFPIAVGDTISNGVPGPGAGTIESPGVRDIYTFTAIAGQQLYFDVLNVPIELAQVNWQLTAPNGDIVFDKILNCCNVGEPGYFELVQGGVYTITVGDDLEPGTGGYSFKVWQVPPPDHFTIAVGDTISDGVPGPGAGHIESPAAHDIYTFTASAGQQVQPDLLSSDSALGNVTWQMNDSNGAQLFSTCFSCAQPGPLTLTAGGVYTITVGSNGTDGTGIYSFQMQSP